MSNANNDTSGGAIPHITITMPPPSPEKTHGIHEESWVNTPTLDENEAALFHHYAARANKSGNLLSVNTSNNNSNTFLSGGDHHSEDEEQEAIQHYSNNNNIFNNPVSNIHGSVSHTDLLPLQQLQVPSRKIDHRWARKRLLMRRNDSATHHNNTFLSSTGEFFSRTTRVGKIIFNLFGWCLPARLQSQEIQAVKVKADVQYKDMTELQKQNLREFLVDLCFALASHGLPSYRLEYHLSIIAAFFGLAGLFYATPTGVFMSFGEDPQQIADNKVRFVRIASNVFDMYKLCLLDDIADDVSHGNISIAEAKKKIDEVLKSVPKNPVLRIICYMIRSACFAVLLSGNVPEIIAGLFAGFFYGIIALLSAKVEVVGSLINLLAAVGSFAIGTAFKTLIMALNARTDLDLPDIRSFLVALSGVIIPLPGYTFAIAISELSYNNLISGVGRMLSGFVVVLQLGFGLVIGHNIEKLLSLPADPVLTVSYPIIMPLITVPLTVATYILLLRLPSYALSIVFSLAACTVATIAPILLNPYLGREVSALISCTAMGLVGNLYSKLSNHPSIAITTGSLFIMVPGSYSIRAVYSIITKDITKSADHFVTLSSK